MSSSDALRNALPFNIGRVFDKVEIAETAIDRAMKRCKHDPAAVERVWGSFRAVSPQEGFWDMPDDLFRRHCEEFLQRVADGVTGPALNCPTDAEMVWTLRNLSLIHPLREDAALVYERLFRRLMPGALERAGMPTNFFRESFDGSADQTLDDLMQHLARGIRRDPVEPRRPPQVRLNALRITLPDPAPEQIPLF